jgi:PAS domain S-box-containing protein
MLDPDLLEIHRLVSSGGQGIAALHVVIAAVFMAACLAMAVAWLWLAHARPDLARTGVLNPLVAFVLASGITRLMTISAPWRSDAGPAWAMEAVTTCLAVLTSIALWRSLPARLNDQLAAEVADQRRTLALLRERDDLAREVNIALEKRIAEKTAELETANDRLSGIVNSAMDALITIDDQQRIVLFNPAAAQMFGVRAEDMLGEPIGVLLPERFRADHAGHIRSFAETGATNRRMGGLKAITGLRANGEEFPLEASISQIAVGGAWLATIILRDITEREAAECTRRLLAAEVDHRAKNALAVVQAVVSLTRAPSKEAFVEAVLGRISALARAHTILAENHWRGGDMFRIIADETAPYAKPGQIRMLGSSVGVNLSAVQPISLIIHELAANAVKYGALSVDDGRVDVEVNLLESGELRLSWTELGGPAVAPPATTGFGTTLITKIANRQLRGVIDIAWPTDGLRLVATLPPPTFDQTHTHPPPAQPAPAPTAPGDGPAGGKVLVVEDELLISLELCEGLRVLGWEIVGPATTVADALRLIDDTPKIDVAILDINLDGEFVYPVAERLRSLGMPFVYCTGYEQPSHEWRRAEDATLRKPVNMALLTQQLRTLNRAA